MKYYNKPCLTLIILLVAIFIAPLSTVAQQETSFQYVSPKPNSIMVSNETNIILRHSNKLQESTIIQNLITVVGSLSGIHTGEFLINR